MDGDEWFDYKRLPKSWGDLIYAGAGRKRDNLTRYKLWRLLWLNGMDPRRAWDIVITYTQGKQVLRDNRPKTHRQFQHLKELKPNQDIQVMNYFDLTSEKVEKSKRIRTGNANI